MPNSLGLRAPNGLSLRARQAWRKCMLEEPEAERFQAVITDYARAISRVDALTAEWDDLGRPMITVSQNGRDFVHPLIPAIEAAEIHVRKQAEALGLTPAANKALRGARGRPKESIPSLPAAQRIRAVK